MKWYYSTRRKPLFISTELLNLTNESNRINFLLISNIHLSSADLAKFNLKQNRVTVNISQVVIGSLCRQQPLYLIFFCSYERCSNGKQFTKFRTSVFHRRCPTLQLFCDTFLMSEEYIANKLRISIEKRAFCLTKRERRYLQV